MKVFKCPFCSKEKYKEDKVIMVVCSACQVEMEEVKKGGKERS